jgi:molybdopterin converting factor small subunit
MKKPESEAIISIKVAGVFSGAPLNKSLQEPYFQGDTVKRVLERLDKRKVLGRRFFKQVMKQGRAVFLLNGDRLELPGSRTKPLNAGDEISVLSAIAGG